MTLTRMKEPQMSGPCASSSDSWQTKPSDRFILKWIKCNLSAPVTRRIAGIRFLKPWMITITGTIIAICAGVILASGWGFVAGLLIAAAQILDGVDGQFARITGDQSRAGAFLDSVLDRYSDGFLVIGLTIFNLRLGFPEWVIFALGAFAVIGSGLVSYSSARGENLRISFGPPTLASKGTRTAVTAVSCLLSPMLPNIQFAALCYLVIHSNSVVLYRISKAYGMKSTESPGPDVHNK